MIGVSTLVTEWYSPVFSVFQQGTRSIIPKLPSLSIGGPWRHRQHSVLSLHAIARTHARLRPVPALLAPCPYCAARTPPTVQHCQLPTPSASAHQRPSHNNILFNSQTAALSRCQLRLSVLLDYFRCYRFVWVVLLYLSIYLFIYPYLCLYLSLAMSDSGVYVCLYIVRYIGLYVRCRLCLQVPLPLLSSASKFQNASRC